MHNLSILLTDKTPFKGLFDNNIFDDIKEFYYFPFWVIIFLLINTPFIVGL